MAGGGVGHLCDGVAVVLGHVAGTLPKIGDLFKQKNVRTFIGQGFESVAETAHAEQDEKFDPIRASPCYVSTLFLKFRKHVNANGTRFKLAFTEDNRVITFRKPHNVYLAVVSIPPTAYFLEKHRDDTLGRQFPEASAANFLVHIRDMPIDKVCHRRSSTTFSWPDSR